MCIAGDAETVKIFINEAPGSGRVQNIKLMWNEWTEDMGWGVGSDRAVASDFLKRITALYLQPEVDSRIQDVYFGSYGMRFATQRFTVEYRWTAGPEIDEHLLVLEPR